MPPSLALSLLSEIVIAWLAVSLIVALAFGVMSARLSDRRRFRDRRRGPHDRRSGTGDRRIGLPDLRVHPTERRRGSADRRGGPPDRRGPGRRSGSLALGS